MMFCWKEKVFVPMRGETRDLLDYCIQFIMVLHLSLIRQEKNNFSYNKIRLKTPIIPLGT